MLCWDLKLSNGHYDLSQATGVNTYTRDVTVPVIASGCKKSVQQCRLSASEISGNRTELPPTSCYTSASLDSSPQKSGMILKPPFLSFLHICLNVFIKRKTSQSQKYRFLLLESGDFVQYLGQNVPTIVDFYFFLYV